MGDCSGCGRRLLTSARRAEPRARAEAALPSASGLAAAALHQTVGVACALLGDDQAAIAALEAGLEKADDCGLRTMVWSLASFIARLRADRGEPDEAIADLRRIADDADAAGATVDALWTRTAAANTLLEVRPAEAATAAAELARACRDAEFIDGWDANLRTLTIAELLAGDVVAAAATVTEVLDDLWGRGAIRKLRLAMYAAAAVLEAAGHPAAPDVAASIESFPYTSLFWRPGHEPVRLRGPVGQRREPAAAVALARDGLAEVADGAPLENPAMAGPGVPYAEGHLARDGDVWTLRFAGRTVRLKASKGLADLARLLDEPGREVHCLDMMGAAAEQSTTGPVIDDAARRSYEQRLRELQDDIDDAEQRNDAARAERLQAEFDQLVDHLTAALGLRGRTRHGTSSAERARSAVTQRIRGAIRTIADAHPELGRHLTAAIATGTFCAYRPEHVVTWHVTEPAAPAALS